MTEHGRWLPVEGSHLGLTDCGGCGAEVASTEEGAAEAFCLTCHMTNQGVGDRWNLNSHPRFAGPGSDPLAYAPGNQPATTRPSIGGTAPGAREVRWGCLGCGETGVADNADHAIALGKVHRGYACPAAATSATDPPARAEDVKKGKGHTFRDPDGFDARVGRRKALTRLYPDEVPPYTKPYRGH